MKKCYKRYQMRPVIDSLTSAQHAIESIVIQNEEENIFDYRTENPELYKLFMEINELCCKVFEMSDE